MSELSQGSVYCNRSEGPPKLNCNASNHIRILHFMDKVSTYLALYSVNKASACPICSANRSASSLFRIFFSFERSATSGGNWAISSLKRKFHTSAHYLTDFTVATLAELLHPRTPPSPILSTNSSTPKLLLDRFVRPTRQVPSLSPPLFCLLPRLLHRLTFAGSSMVARRLVAVSMAIRNCTIWVSNTS